MSLSLQEVPVTAAISSDCLVRSGPIPQAVSLMTAMSVFDTHGNSLHGPIPHGVGFMSKMENVYVFDNKLDGSIPQAVGSMIAIRTFSVYCNRLRGPIAHVVGSMTAMWIFNVHQNSLRGSIPHALGSITKMMSLEMSHNSLCGPIPDVVGSLTAATRLIFNHNGLRGTIPCALASIPELTFEANGNSLSGSIPAAVTFAKDRSIRIFSVSDNQLSGSIPGGIMTFTTVILHGNRFTGTLPTLQNVGLLLASGNMLEGRLSSTIASRLAMLDLSGVPGRIGGLNGPLPTSLRRAKKLQILTVANQQMDGQIPSFTSTLWLLALHKNRLKVLPDIQLSHNASRTAILLYDNLLSCYVPLCGNASATTSVIAIGNRLRHPKGEFPAWVRAYEHDPLFWVSGNGGASLLHTVVGAVALFIHVVASKLGRHRLLKVVLGWHSGPATHLWVVEALSHLHACLLIEASMAVVFFMPLLSWDLYACPQTLALASACLRSSGLIQAFVFFCWCRLSFHSVAVGHLTMKDETRKKWAAQMTRTRLLFWLLWCALTVALSTVTILYQVGKSIPGFLQVGKTLALGFKACIGSAQALVTGFIVPFLASKMTQQKHVYSAVASLLMSCLIPALVIIYLDAGCLGRWVYLWRPCRGNSGLFGHRLICTEDNGRDCYETITGDLNIDIMVVRSDDICDPHFSLSASSMSRCVHISLLRLQEIWLTKFVTTGVVMPGVALLRNKLPTESGSIVGNLVLK